MSTSDFLPLFTERETHPGHTVRWGMMPNGREKSLGALGFVPLAESLSIYKAALRRTKIVHQDRVVFMRQNGSAEELDWQGNPT